MKKLYLLFFVLIFSCSYSALPYASFAHEAFKIAKNGGGRMADDFISRAVEEAPKLLSEERAVILERLILTGNKHLLSLFLNLGIIKPRDITETIILYARERAAIHLANGVILNTLLQEQKAREERKALRQQMAEEKKNRKRKPTKDINPRPAKKTISKEPDTCRICLDEYTAENPATRMKPKDPKCKHKAHKECFSQWCASAGTDSCIFCNQGPKRDIPEEWMQWIFGDQEEEEAFSINIFV